GLKGIPPFFGMFGSAEMIAKLGFHSKPGSYIEYQLTGGGAGMRIAEVGPAVAGARWIEITARVPEMAETQGMRFLARGEKDGNIERFVVHVSGMPPMEMPMEAVGRAGGSGISGVSAHMLGPMKSVGHEKITTPIGEFE